MFETAFGCSPVVSTKVIFQSPVQFLPDPRVSSTPSGPPEYHS